MHSSPSWRLPLLLYLLTWITTTILHDGAPLSVVDGLWFSVPLMLILSCHECGHFVQSRRYGVQASLPYFIPMPFGPFGTLGAVIVMGGRIPSSRALFDIGISGPIAGLVPTLLCCYYGIKWSLVAPLHDGADGLVFGDPLLFAWMTSAIHGPLASDIVLLAHPVAMAGWVGLLLTSLNLIPLGQLDGGHVLHALCGRFSAVIARVVFYLLVILVLLFQWWHWVLLLVLLAMMGIVHPPTQNDAEPLGWTRRLLGWGMLAFIIIGLTPVPLDMDTNTNSNDDRRNTLVVLPQRENPVYFCTALSSPKLQN